jgi:hypothetical protein
MTQRDNAFRSEVEDFVATAVEGVMGRCSQVMTDVQVACASLQASVSSLPLRLGQKFNDVIMAAVMNPGSALIKSLRAAIRRPTIRSTHSHRQFPKSQKATQVEILGKVSTLLSVALAAFPEITYDVWKAVRSSFGKAIKSKRLQRHALGEGSEEYIDRPLLWSFVGEGTSEGGGQRYVLLREHEEMAREVWFAPRSVGLGC